MSQLFDFDQALKQLQSGQGLTGQDSILMPLIKQLTEAAIKAKLEQHLTYSDVPNRKNGTTAKMIKTGSGNFILDTPRDRASTFEPKLIKKNKTQLTPVVDHKILALFSLGTSYRDIQLYIKELYGIEVSSGTISAVTDQL